MQCRKCLAEIPDNSVFCNLCGVRQEVTQSKKKRGNGQGCVYRTSTSWAAEVTLGYFIENGKRKRKMKRKCGFKTKKEAVLYLSTLQTMEEKPKSITMSELWVSYSNSWELSDSKQTAYKIAWRKICQEVGWRTVDSFTVDELQEIVDSSAPSYYTRRDIKTVLSKLYQIAIRDDYEDKNRASFIKLPKLITTERATFTDDEIQILWQDYVIKKEPITAQMLIMLYTGIRPGELLTIHRDNINLKEHYMTGGIKTEKGKNRKIVIPDKIISLISELTKTNTRLASYHREWDFYEAWNVKRVSLGLREELKPYCARHTYVTNVTKLGVSPAMLQELVGHEDYDTTLIYTHLSVEDRLKEVNRL